jgi:hypothetical protein
LSILTKKNLDDHKEEGRSVLSGVADLA